jgi:hypothetical protein
MVADRLPVEDIVWVPEPVPLETRLLVLGGLPLCEIVFVELSDRDPKLERVGVPVGVAKTLLDPDDTAERDLVPVLVAVAVGLREAPARDRVAEAVPVGRTPARDRVAEAVPVGRTPTRDRVAVAVRGTTAIRDRVAVAVSVGETVPIGSCPPIGFMITNRVNNEVNRRIYI